MPIREIIPAATSRLGGLTKLSTSEFDVRTRSNAWPCTSRSCQGAWNYIAIGGTPTMEWMGYVVEHQ